MSGERFFKGEVPTESRARILKEDWCLVIKGIKGYHTILQFHF